MFATVTCVDEKGHRAAVWLVAGPVRYHVTALDGGVGAGLLTPITPTRIGVGSVLWGLVCWGPNMAWNPGETMRAWQPVGCPGVCVGAA